MNPKIFILLKVIVSAGMILFGYIRISQRSIRV